MTKSNTAELATSDNVYMEVHADVPIAMDSIVIKGWIKYGTGFYRLSFRNYILKKVIEFCKKHADIQSSSGGDEKVSRESLMDFYSQFVKENQRILIDLLCAACDLRIRSLLDLTSEAVADMMTGKTGEEIHAMFKLKKDFTFEEMGEAIEYDPFCFKGIIEFQFPLMAEDSFSLNRLREKIAVGYNSKVFAAKYSSLTFKEKKAWVITAALIREEKRLLAIARRRDSKPCSYLTKEEKIMLMEDAVWEEVCKTEEPEIFELNGLFLSG